jgi:hypothetical protein
MIVYSPWTLKGRTWVFVLPKTSELPSGFAAPFEADVLGSSGEYIGGPGFIMVRDFSLKFLWLASDGMLL